jgi:hypothetical protein
MNDTSAPVKGPLALYESGLNFILSRPPFPVGEYIVGKSAITLTTKKILSAFYLDFYGL